MDVYDIAVIGAGPAGIMAAIRAAQLGKKVVLAERNDAIGKKLLITGKTRCNVTNSASIETFIEKFGKQGPFLRTAFFAFSNQDLTAFFEDKGLKLKTERQGRVFPVTDKSGSIVSVLKSCLVENGVKILYDMRLKHIKKEDAGEKNKVFGLYFDNKKSITAGKIILATGGSSYSVTGSSGDGFRIAAETGHTIVGLRPALVPLKAGETWIKELQGLTLKNVRVIFEYADKDTDRKQINKKKKKGKGNIASNVGELLFTHFGISGPLVLDLSGEITALMQADKQITACIDLKPGLSDEQLERKLLNEFKTRGKAQLKTIMKDMLPQRLISVFIGLAGLDEESKVSQMTQEQRRSIISLLKRLPLTISGSLSLDKAMVTAGGIPAGEINPRTMESKIMPGLYFAGEIIDGSAPSGGYNLQQAFSTGYLAGEEASHA